LNNPIKYTDPTGNWFESLFDVGSIIYSAGVLYNDPSWSNVGWLTADIACAAVPFVPATGVLRAGADVAGAAASIDRRVPDEILDLEKGIKNSVLNNPSKPDMAFKFEELPSNTFMRTPSAEGPFNKLMTEWTRKGALNEKMTLNDLKNINTKLQKSSGDPDILLGIRGIDNGAFITTNHDKVTKIPNVAYSTYDRVPGLLKDMNKVLDFYSSKSWAARKTPKLAQELFVTIHPFADANGRTGRIFKAYWAGKQMYKWDYYDSCKSEDLMKDYFNKKSKKFSSCLEDKCDNDLTLTKSEDLANKNNIIYNCGDCGSVRVDQYS